ncbi:3-methyl-2-oxobutanoate dehydrogenase subunit beta [archaeon]|nr:3-methyl-2-oxobutanoate dehydrogenase subunit beta [archaeon]
MKLPFGLPREEFLLPGHTACPGCGATIALRIVMKALGPRTVFVIPACCSTVIQGIFPGSSFAVPVVNIPFEAAAAVAAGVSAALEQLGEKDFSVVAWAGDGGTFDIGLQALSGAAERNDNILYICYDNEMYSNTGIQRSSATPIGAWTTTTPTGKREHKKDLLRIVSAHHVPYAATATIAFPKDLYEKVRKARQIRGFKFLHILTPCPVGWRFDASKTVEISRLAVQTGYWALYEIEHGKLRISPAFTPYLDKSRRKPIDEFLKHQLRFRTMTPELKAELERAIEEGIERLKREAELV